MKVEVYDHSNDAVLLKLETPCFDFGSNMFNLLMANLAERLGPTFQKISSDSLDGPKGIVVTYSHNISAVIIP